LRAEALSTTMQEMRALLLVVAIVCGACNGGGEEPTLADVVDESIAFFEDDPSGFVYACSVTSACDSERVTHSVSVRSLGVGPEMRELSVAAGASCLAWTLDHCSGAAACDVGCVRQ
jgi:hypothetical protein